VAADRLGQQVDAPTPDALRVAVVLVVVVVVIERMVVARLGVLRFVRHDNPRIGEREPPAALANAWR
jgi:hypothetical protein